MKQAGDIENLTIIPGPLSIENNLLDLYCKSSIYLQLSIDESFGMAVVEAMACGCIPIVSQYGALTEIVPGSDFIATTQEELLILTEKYFNSPKSCQSVQRPLLNFSNGRTGSFIKISSNRTLLPEQ